MPVHNTRSLAASDFSVRHHSEFLANGPIEATWFFKHSKIEFNESVKSSLTYGLLSFFPECITDRRLAIAKSVPSSHAGGYHRRRIWVTRARAARHNSPPRASLAWLDSTVPICVLLVVVNRCLGRAAPLLLHSPTNRTRVRVRTLTRFESVVVNPTHSTVSRKAVTPIVAGLFA